MRKIPRTENAAVIRTDFSNEPAWDSICAEIVKPNGTFKAYVDFVNEWEFAGLSPQKLIDLLPDELNQLFFFVVDSSTLSNPEHPILIVGLADDLGKSFRVIPSEMWSVENNLSIANMDFDEFVAAVDSDGIFRGFSR